MDGMTSDICCITEKSVNLISIKSRDSKTYAIEGLDTIDLQILLQVGIVRVECDYSKEADNQ